MLEIEGLEVRYGQARAVAGLSLGVPAGGWVTLIGPNGAGKTSVLRAVMGLVRHAGRVRLGGEDLARLPPWERQARGLGYVPEGRQVFAAMTVEENLRVGAYRRSRPEVAQALESVFATFPRLRERRSQQASTLSGGEQQMLALGRALMARPRLLLVDEISWGLMPILVEQVFARLSDLYRDGLAILQVEQNARDVLRRAQHAYLMAAGEMVLDGPAERMARDPRVVESYVG